MKYATEFRFYESILLSSLSSTLYYNNYTYITRILHVQAKVEKYLFG